VKDTHPFPTHLADELARRCVSEDLGNAGDITAQTTLAADLRTEAKIVARQAGCVAGLTVAMRVFEVLEADVVTTIHIPDGTVVVAGTVLATLRGSARDVVTGERSALNILGHASGIATATHNMASLIADLPTVLVDTRKTTPGLRALDKYAVRVGGGHNHRLSLDGAVMIKDNHIAGNGSITAAVEAARSSLGHTTKIEVEIERLDQLAEALSSGADIIMLDNMSNAEMATAVRLCAGSVILEASGGITEDNIRAVAQTGVNVISVGWLTQSAPAMDVALDFATGLAN